MAHPRLEPPIWLFLNTPQSGRDWFWSLGVGDVVIVTVRSVVIVVIVVVIFIVVAIVVIDIIIFIVVVVRRGVSDVSISRFVLLGR